MAVNEQYSAANLMLLIWSAAARKGFKPDYSGLRKLAIEVAGMKRSSKPLFDEKYLDKKFTQARNNLEAHNDRVSAREENIQALAEYAGYPRLEDFFIKADSLFEFLGDRPPILDITRLSEEDKLTFTGYISDTYQYLLFQAPSAAESGELSSLPKIKLYVSDQVDKAGPPGVFTLRFTKESGYMDTSQMILADPFPIDFMAIALQVYLSDTRNTQKLTHYIKKESEKKARSQPAMRNLPVTSKPPPAAPPRFPVWKVAFFVALFLLASCLATYFFILRPAADKPDHRELEKGITKRKQQIEALVREAEHRTNRRNDTLAGIQYLIDATLTYDSISTYYRNYYGFTNGYTIVEFKKNIEPVIEKDINKLTPWNQFGFVQPIVMGGGKMSLQTDTTFAALYFTFGIVETVPPDPTVVSIRKGQGGKYIVRVRYTRPIRYLNIRYELSEETGWYKTRTLSWVGFLPEEKLVFQKMGDVWEYTGLSQ
ncbi:hypothetical protein AB9P05_16615 [Roseivirga sp. BDSF3-8]|uniref:hypothetical protein n=1 Tax=Roseivirga sp. BDSF3-8 TaxID=3241598 RepID=UPI003531BD85